MSGTRQRHPSTAQPARRGDMYASRRRHPTARPVARPGPAGVYVGLVVVLATLNLVGLVMVLSASSVSALDEYGSSWYVALRQAMWLAVGVTLCAVVARIDYHRWRRPAPVLLVASLVLLVLVFVPGVGMTANGATRWLGYGPFTVQPSEIAKLAVLVYAADLLARRATWMHEPRRTLVPVALVYGGVAFLIMCQPNLGTTLVIGAMVLTVLYVAGTPLLPLGGLTVAGGAVAALLALGASYRRDRVFAFLDPWADPLGDGYQNIQSLVGLASGGLTGTGLGASRAKWGFLPYAHTDFIFAIIGEELGLIGALVVVGLFIALCVLGVRAAVLAPDRFGMLLAAGVTAWFGVQAFVNIGAVTGVLPITGVPLPFVSYGGSSLVFSMLAAGLLLGVARHAGARPPVPPADAARAVLARSR